MKKKQLSNKHTVLIIAAIMLLQCFVMVHWQSMRGNFFIDEYYSFGYAKSFAKDNTTRITGSDLWETNTWIDAEPLVKLLKVEKEDSLFSEPVSKALSLLATKRTYVGLLNMAFTGKDTLNEYAFRSMVINLIFLVIAEMLLAYLLKSLTGSSGIAILGVIMFGFSALMTSMCEYVRFYMMTNMLLLLVVVCHYKMWTTKQLRYFFWWEIIAFAAAYNGLVHSEFYMVICGAFFTFFIVGLLCRKKFLQALIYAVPLGFAVYKFVYLKMDLIYAAFHLKEYARKGWGKAGVAYRLVNITKERLQETAHMVLRESVDSWFGSIYVLIAFACLLIVCVVLMIRKKGSGSKKKDENRYAWFAVMLFLTGVIGLTFNILALLNAGRYHSYSITLLMIAFWYFVNAVCRRVGDRRVLAAVCLLTLIGAVICQRPEKIRYLFADEKSAVETISEYADLDAVFYELPKDGVAAYDCVAHCSEEARVFVVDTEMEVPVSQMKPSDQFVAWCCSPHAVKKMIRSLNGSDYRFTFLGNTHKNRVFLCTKEK